MRDYPFLPLPQILLAVLLSVSMGATQPAAAQDQDSVRVPSSDVDAAYDRWREALVDKRLKAKEVPQSNKAPAPRPAGQAAPAAAGGGAKKPPAPAEGGSDQYIEIGGKRVAIKSTDPPASSPGVDSASAGEVVAPATGEIGAVSVESATSAMPAPPAPAVGGAAPPVEMVTIKVAKLVDGKIVEVEVQVTPTPGPAGDAPKSAPQAQAPAGDPGSLQAQLSQAAKSPKPTHFDQPTLRKILAEFQAAKKKPDFAQKMPENRAQVLQMRLQRLSVMAQGGELAPAPAKALLDLLYPPPKPAGPPPGAPQGGQAPPPPPGQGNQPPPPPPQEEEQYYEELPQIYWDPNTGQYIYEDGSPAPPPEELYYQDTGQYQEEGNTQGNGN
jgi:hypothetical protein